MDVVEPILSESEFARAGQAAMQRADWEAARRAFTEAISLNETAATQWRLGQALWFLNEMEPSLAHFRRAYALYRSQGDPTAARLASWIALEHAAIHGDASVARGWFARAARILKDREPCPDLGWFLVNRAIFVGDIGGLESAARRAMDLGGRFGDTDLEFWAQITLGQAVVFSGRVSEGMALIEEAMAAVLAGELTDPTVIADCYCFMLGTCECAGDYDLAQEWVSAAAGYAKQRSCPFVAAQCRTTYASVLMAVGRWADAEQELLAVLPMYESGHRGLGTMVVARLADLRIRQGALEEAKDLLAGLEDIPAALLPLARMHLAQGDPVGALALLSPHMPPGALRLTDVALSVIAIEANLAAGKVAWAEDVAGRLGDLAAQTGSRALMAEASFWRGKVAWMSDPERAAVLFAEAVTLCPYPDAPLAGRIRLEQARITAPTDPSVAVVHARAALACFQRIEAPAEVDAALNLLRSLGSPTRLASPPGASTSGLTRRERDVLALVGAGLSNPQIAKRLYLSPKTVEHHVAHIFDKLGLRSRAALAAYAARGGTKIGEFPDVDRSISGADSR